jgi:hypothetical protein
MQNLKLYMLLLGCRPPGRNTEQHDVFFSIGHSIKELVPQMKAFWPEAKGTLHVDAWREVTHVNGYKITVVPREEGRSATALSEEKLFFLNLGGYKPGEFDELHYKMLAVAKSKSEAMKQARQTAFYKYKGFKGAASHIDDKFGVDVDDLYEVKDILPVAAKEACRLQIIPNDSIVSEDELYLGYFKLYKLP